MESKTQTTVVAAIGGITAVLAAAIELSTTVQKFFLATTSVPKANAVVVLLLVALVSGGLWVRSISSRKRSRLRDKAKFVIRIDELHHDQLRGREADVQDVIDLCTTSRQVFVDGVSGVGKSAMFRAGVLPAMRSMRAWMPIYMNTWGTDWVEGPRTALRDAILRSLSEEVRTSVRGSKLWTDPFMLLDYLAAQSGRTPILIFDQFDDYV